MMRTIVFPLSGIRKVAAGETIGDAERARINRPATPKQFRGNPVAKENFNEWAMPAYTQAQQRAQGMGMNERMYSDVLKNFWDRMVRMAESDGTYKGPFTSGLAYKNATRTGMRSPKYAWR